MDDENNPLEKELFNKQNFIIKFPEMELTEEQILKKIFPEYKEEVTRGYTYTAHEREVINNAVGRLNEWFINELERNMQQKEMEAQQLIPNVFQAKKTMSLHVPERIREIWDESIIAGHHHRYADSKTKRAARRKVERDYKKGRLFITKSVRENMVNIYNKLTK